MTNKTQPSLFSAVAIGVGSIIGSGWLFASYFASQYAGPASILSWIIGAVFSLFLALLLAEIATMYQVTGLFSRLLTISHNKDIGFVIAVSNWFSMVCSVPSEATATVEYLGHAYPSIAQLMFNNGNLTWIGIIAVYAILFIYGLLNYWGIKTLTKVNNVVSTIKMIVPALIGIIFIFAAFHPENFTAYKGTIAPYGFGNAFTAVVTCGIFYAFYGFSTITIFAQELKNPKRNIPLALCLSVFICLIIYLILQVSFIGAMDPTTIRNEGWHTLHFDSPLANLAILFGMNWMALILYIDAAISPSGTGIIYTGSGTRMLSSMSQDKQMPEFFAKFDPKFFISRRALIFTLALCMIMVAIFDNWQKIMIIVSMFELIACLAIPIAFSRLRRAEKDRPRVFRLGFGETISTLSFIAVSYLIIQCGFVATELAVIVHSLFFLVYCGAYYKFNIRQTKNAFLSSFSVFLYLFVMMLFAYLSDKNMLHTVSGLIAFIFACLVLSAIFQKQRNYS